MFLRSARLWLTAFVLASANPIPHSDAGETIMETPSPDVLSQLAPTGTVRVAINLGNPVLAQRNAATGELSGISVDLARELGRRLDRPVAFTTFDSAGKVFEALSSGVLDLVFLAIDPERAKEILFTGPYVIIEGTYIVREKAPFHTIADLDRPGVRIAVGKGAAYDLFLTRTLTSADLVRADTSADAVTLFALSDLDAAAGVRQPLAAYAASHPGFRVIDGRFTAILQAMGTPKDRPAARQYLQSFVETMKANGFVAEALVKSGREDAGIAPPQPNWPEF
jgi:polar amino acid transport system substrate-binding protein